MVPRKYMYVLRASVATQKVYILLVSRRATAGCNTPPRPLATFKTAGTFSLFPFNHWTKQKKHTGLTP